MNTNLPQYANNHLKAQIFRFYFLIPLRFTVNFNLIKID